MNPKNPFRPTVQTLDDLMKQNLPPARYIVPGILPSGLSILASQPKLGKSWLALGLSLAIGSGGKAFGSVQVAQGDVLYLALEDTPQRLQDRTGQLLQGQPAPAGVRYALEWPRMHDGGLDALKGQLDAAPVRLLIIDTLAKVRPPRRSNGNAYDEDYATVGALKRLADEREMSIMLIHHTRKGSSDDVMQEISGTTGIAGAADTMLVLKRGRSERGAILHITGRDVEERSLGMSFDASIGLWKLDDTTAQDGRPDEQEHILAFLRQGGAGNIKDVAAGIGKNEVATRQLLTRMYQAELLTRAARGVYALPTGVTMSQSGTNPDAARASACDIPQSSSVTTSHSSSPLVTPPTEAPSRPVEAGVEPALPVGLGPTPQPMWPVESEASERDIVIDTNKGNVTLPTQTTAGAAGVCDIVTEVVEAVACNCRVGRQHRDGGWIMFQGQLTCFPCYLIDRDIERVAKNPDLASEYQPSIDRRLAAIEHAKQATA